MKNILIILTMLLSFVGCSNENIINKGDEYQLIKFTDFEVINSDLELIEGESFELLVNKDGTVFIDDNATIIENHYDKFYIVDIDNDDIKEVITRTTEKMISPFTNNYHIYKYIVNNEEFEEIVTISIMGSIDSFYIGGNDIKVVYHPFESPKDYIQEKHYEIREIS